MEPVSVAIAAAVVLLFVAAGSDGLVVGVAGCAGDGLVVEAEVDRAEGT
jgi:hypothetical protein